MVKVVLDTNVLVSAMLSNHGSSYRLLHLCAEKKVRGFTCEPVLSEFKRAAQRDYNIPLERAEQMVDVYMQFLSLVESKINLSVVADEPDNRVLECAASVRADYLASWDHHLTELKEFQGIKIFEPGKIVSELREVHGIE